MSRDLPPQVAAEIVCVLDWIEAHPRGKWDDMGELFAVYQKWRDIIRGSPPLLDEMGTQHTVPGLSSFGRIFLLEHRPEPQTPPAGGSKVPPDAEGGPTGQPPTGGRPAGKLVTVNERMAVMLQEDPTRVEWSATKWSEALSSALVRCVSSAAVKQTDTWRIQIKGARALMEAERAARGEQPRKRR